MEQLSRVNTIIFMMFGFQGVVHSAVWSNLSWRVHHADLCMFSKLSGWTLQKPVCKETGQSLGEYSLIEKAVQNEGRGDLSEYGIAFLDLSVVSALLDSSGTQSKQMKIQKDMFITPGSGHWKSNNTSLTVLKDFWLIQWPKQLLYTKYSIYLSWLGGSVRSGSSERKDSRYWAHVENSLDLHWLAFVGQSGVGESPVNQWPCQWGSDLRSTSRAKPGEIITNVMVHCPGGVWGKTQNAERCQCIIWLA